MCFTVVSKGIEIRLLMQHAKVAYMYYNGAENGVARGMSGHVRMRQKGETSRCYDDVEKMVVGGMKKRLLLQQEVVKYMFTMVSKKRFPFMVRYLHVLKCALENGYPFGQSIFVKLAKKCHFEALSLDYLVT